MHSLNPSAGRSRLASRSKLRSTTLGQVAEGVLAQFDWHRLGLEETQTLGCVPFPTKCRVKRHFLSPDKYIQRGAPTMKIREIVEAMPQKPTTVQPSVVRQQNKVANVVGQIAASEEQQPATEEEKVLAMWRYRRLEETD